MPITGEEKKITEHTEEKEAFIATFTNGAFTQLKNLQEFYKQPDLNELIKLSISFLQQIKERKEKEEAAAKKTTE